MSGGSFDYLYSQFENENPLDTWALEMLAKMAEWLEEEEQSQHEASAELKHIHSELIQIKERVGNLIQNERIIRLIKAAEWWCSHDTGKDTFESEWSKYKRSS